MVQHTRIELQLQESVREKRRNLGQRAVATGTTCGAAWISFYCCIHVPPLLHPRTWAVSPNNINLRIRRPQNRYGLQYVWSLLVSIV